MAAWLSRSALAPAALLLLPSLLAQAAWAGSRSPLPAEANEQGSPLRLKVLETVRDARRRGHLRAVLVRASVDGREIVNEAFGESMGGVPATTAMHFRNGAVAISYVSTLLLRLVDEQVVRLDDRVSRWLPDLPNADRVSLRQLAQMTSGYGDYVHNPAFIEAFYRDPFRTWITQELIAYARPEVLLYEPGSNWNYAHTNVVILGLALERATGQPLERLLRSKVLDPLGLADTTDPGSPALPEPALHAFSSERRPALKVPAAIPFSEETTYWNPSWTLARGAIQTTTLADLHATAIGIGSGRLLSPSSHRAMVSTDLRGRTRAQPGCSTCMPQVEGYTYGLGIITTGNWLTQNPLFGGYAASFGYLPSRRVAIAVAVTFEPSAFDEQGNVENGADLLFRRIGAVLAPDDAPPMPPAP